MVQQPIDLEHGRIHFDLQRGGNHRAGDRRIKATLNKSLAARSALFWAVCSVANPRHSWAMAVVCALQPSPNQGAHTREDLFSMALTCCAKFLSAPWRFLGPRFHLLCLRAQVCPTPAPPRCRTARSASAPGGSRFPCTAATHLRSAGTRIRPGSSVRC